jgi:prevent-host-death family protein
MGITTLSSREFNQDASRAKKATSTGPVFITDRGKPAHVLLTIEEYRRLRGERGISLLQALTPKTAAEDFDFDPPKLGQVSKPADLD